MIEDRKFYYAVMRPPPEETNTPARGPGGFGSGRRGVGPGRWNPIGPVDSVVRDPNTPFNG
jgi:hypothetical protein